MFYAMKCLFFCFPYLGKSLNAFVACTICLKGSDCCSRIDRLCCKCNAICNTVCLFPNIQSGSCIQKHNLPLWSLFLSGKNISGDLCVYGSIPTLQFCDFTPL
mgnify:CR=1 FL=1